MEDNPNSVVITMRVLPVTRDHIREISKQTYRGIGDTVDWLVDEYLKRHPELNSDIEKEETPCG